MGTTLGVFTAKELFHDRLIIPMLRFAETVWTNPCESEGESLERKGIIKSLAVDMIQEAIRGGFSQYDLAKELYRSYKELGYPIEPTVALKIVKQQQAEVESTLYKADDFDFYCDDTCSSAWRRRMSAVKSWSDDSAFVFGVDDIDSLTGGVHPGEMMAVAGAQGSMKTSLLLSGIENAIGRGMKVHFYSLDMDAGEIQERRALRVLGCSQKELWYMVRQSDKRVDLATSKIAGGEIGSLDSLQIFGNDGDSDWTIDKITEQTSVHMPEVVAIDYLTMLRRENQSDLECVNEVMIKLKRMTKTCGTRTIILSQMGRASKREQFSGIIGGHAKGGGIVEELVHSEVELFKDAHDDFGHAPIIATVTKNRRGPSGKSFMLEYDARSMTFTGESTVVERTNKAGRKRAFEKPEMISANWPEDASERRYSR